MVNIVFKIDGMRLKISIKTTSHKRNTFVNKKSQLKFPKNNNSSYWGFVLTIVLVFQYLQVLQYFEIGRQKFTFICHCNQCIDLSKLGYLYFQQALLTMNVNKYITTQVVLLYCQIVKSTITIQVGVILNHCTLHYKYVLTQIV